MKTLHTQKYAPYFIWLLPVILTLSYFWLNPFKDVLVSNTVSLSQLNSAQIANIELGAKALNGFVLAPGQTLSFNQIVGPRTARQGYNKSRSYLEADTPMTFGGGLCLLSSLLYKSALELGLTIKERTAHTRTTQSIPAGFDATIWYGQNDLKFANNKDMPLQIETKIDSQNLTINILGGSKSSPNSSLRRILHRTDKDNIEVTVLKQNGDQLAFVSRDRYRLPTRSSVIDQNKHQINN